jgi:hypothetical protein
MSKLVIVAASTLIALAAVAAQENQDQHAPINKRGAQVTGLFRCLPAGIKLDEIVDTRVVGDLKPENVVRTTVAQALGRLRAVCKNEKLVDASGKEIYFYHRVGCWGNPPQNYGEILQKQQDELDRLKRKYTVVEMTCNPSGMPVR